MKRRLNRFRQIVGLFIALAVTAYGQQACADVLDVGPDGVLAVRINDTPAKLQVRGDWISYLTLNPDATERLGVSSGMFSSMVGIQATVGTTVISGHTGKAKFAVDSKETKERVLWFDKVAAPQMILWAPDVGSNPAVPTNSAISIKGLETANPVLPRSASPNFCVRVLHHPIDAHRISIQEIDLCLLNSSLFYAAASPANLAHSRLSGRHVFASAL